MIERKDVISLDVTTHKDEKNYHNIYKQKLMQRKSTTGSIERLGVDKLFFVSFYKITKTYTTSADFVSEQGTQCKPNKSE